MARIRTVKPSFFRHRRLFLAEQETGMPLRIAYEGLWTCADREGRFKWEPEELKLDCLPFDDVDFSRVMDALFTRGFIVKYACGGRQYGVIPSFKDHQVINNREAASDLPEPPENLEELVEIANLSDASATRDPRDTELHKGKGREGNKEGKGRDSTRDASAVAFEKFWQEYPRTPVMSKKEALAAWGKLSEPDQSAALAAIAPFKAWLATQKDHPVVHACRFLTQRRFDGFSAVPQVVTGPVVPDEKAIDFYKKLGRWHRDYGPEPGSAGCRAPAELLAKYGYQTEAA